MGALSICNILILTNKFLSPRIFRCRSLQAVRSPDFQRRPVLDFAWIFRIRFRCLKIRLVSPSRHTLIQVLIWYLGSRPNHLCLHIRTCQGIPSLLLLLGLYFDLDRRRSLHSLANNLRQTLRRTRTSCLRYCFLTLRSLKRSFKYLGQTLP